MDRKTMNLWVLGALGKWAHLGEPARLTEMQRLRLYRTNDGHADHVVSLGDLVDTGVALMHRIANTNQEDGWGDLTEQVIAYQGLVANAKEII